MNPLLYTLDGRVQRFRVNSRILVSEPNGFVFYRIPKAGHSTVGKTLVHYDPHLTEAERVTIRESGSKSGPYHHPRELNFSQARAAWRNHFKFTFVRNPYRRVLSAYLDKVVRGKPATKNLAENSPTDNTLDFHDFLKQLQGRTLFEGPHWAPQVALLPRDLNRLDFVGQLETIADDLDTLIRHLFGRGMESGVQSWDNHKTDSASEFSRYYDDAAIDTVRTLYREDFTAFGYSMDPASAL